MFDLTKFHKTDSQLIPLANGIKKGVMKGDNRFNLSLGLIIFLRTFLFLM